MSAADTLADVQRDRDNLACIVEELIFDLRVAVYDLGQRNREVEALARQLADLRFGVAAA